MKRSGQVALMTKMSSHDTWLLRISTGCALSLGNSPDTVSSTLTIASRRRDQYCTRARRAPASMKGNTSVVISTPFKRCRAMRPPRTTRVAMLVRLAIIVAACDSLRRAYRSSPQSSRKVFLESRGDLGPREAVVLPAAPRDLDGADQRRQPAGKLPIHAVGYAVQQSGTIGIAAAGRVQNFDRLDARDFDELAAGMNLRSLRAERHDQRLHLSRQAFDFFTGTLLQHLRFVIIDRDVVRHAHEFQ